MEDPVLRSLFERISSDDSLRRTLLDSIQSSEKDQQSSAENVESDDPVENNVDPSRGAQEPLTGDRSSVVAQEHHSRGVNKRGAHELPSSVNPRPPHDGEPPNLDVPGNSRDSLMNNSVDFDPTSMTSGDEFMFDTYEVITNYLETHFHASLSKDVLTAMHKAHPLPRTPAM